MVFATNPARWYAWNAISHPPPFGFCQKRVRSEAIALLLSPPPLNLLQEVGQKLGSQEGQNSLMRML